MTYFILKSQSGLTIMVITITLMSEKIKFNLGAKKSGVKMSGHFLHTSIYRLTVSKSRVVVTEKGASSNRMTNIF